MAEGILFGCSVGGVGGGYIQVLDNSEDIPVKGCCTGGNQTSD